ncbi:MAG: hypothetical protein OXG04_01810 [Acidobacteria bacterium]|nr:hypothetical protein [Acidobacteriota bacterium]
MTVIEAIYAAVLAVLDTLPGRRSVDPFSFDSDPRDSTTAWYVDPPRTTSSGAVGGLESVKATLTIWVSRPAADDAAGAAVALAGELARLRHRLAALDVDDDGRVNVAERIVTDIRPRGPEAITVVGRIVVSFDYEATEGQP